MFPGVDLTFYGDFAIDFGSHPCVHTPALAGFFMRNILALSMLLSLCACAQVHSVAPVMQDFCRPDEGSSYCLMMKDPNGQDVPLCATTVSGGGSQGLMFGPLVRSSQTGRCQQDIWFDAGDEMYRRGNNAIIGCSEPGELSVHPRLEDISSSGHVIPKVIGNRIYIEAIYTKVFSNTYQKACDRLKRDDFSWDEREGRELLSLGPMAVELHSDEYKTEPIWVYFDWPSPVPHMQLTPP